MTIVTVITVTWNSATTLRLCLDSVFAQKGEFVLDVIVVDNASEDESIHVAHCYPGINILENSMNEGYCRANNQGLMQAKGDFVLLLNPDARLSQGYLDAMLKFMVTFPDVALATGKTLRMMPDGAPVQDQGLSVIDSVGIRMKSNRQATNIGGEEFDHGQFEKEMEVFAVDGAVCFCRKAALRQVEVDGQVFDEAFFAYGEDVDLAWRLRCIGWHCCFTPSAIAYHARSWHKGFTQRSIIPVITRYHSFKNRRITILKNETLSSGLVRLPFILGYELVALIYVIFREPFLLKAYATIWKDLHRIRRWRQAMREVIEVNKKQKCDH
jgi:GT2 family glycosyltransferase